MDISEEDFFEEYQLWRNIRFAVKDKNHTTCFLFPKFRNKDLAKTVEAAKAKCRKDVRDRIKIIFADDVVNAMRKSGNKDLKAHYDEFYKKYLDISL